MTTLGKYLCALSGNIAYHFQNNNTHIPENIKGEKIIADRVYSKLNKNGSFTVVIEWGKEELVFENVYPKIVVEGSSVNVSATLTKLGCDTTVFAPVGRDQYGRLIGSSLREAGIDFHPILNRSTAVTAAISEKEGDTTLFCAKPDYTFNIDKLVKKMNGANPSYIITTSSRTETDLLFANKLYEKFPDAKRAFIPHRELLLNEKKNPSEIFQRTVESADILQVNLREFNILLKGEENEYEKFKMSDMKHIIKRFDNHLPKTVIVTLGKEGAASILFANKKHEFFKHAANNIGTIVDTTGAGDCFLAAFIKADSMNMPHQNTINFASWVAALNGLGAGGHYAKIKEDDVLRFQ